MSVNRPDSFWLCHECSAQMRPIRMDGVPHCASCNGEFIEILDSSVNPDPFHELPPAPPVRPGSSASRPIVPSGVPDEGAQGGFLSTLFDMFGAPSEEQGSSTGQPGGGNAVARGGQASAGGRTWTFNVPGGGQGRVMFGGFNGQMGAFGPMGGDQAGGLDSFFPGFAAPPRGPGGQRMGGPIGPMNSMAGPDLMQALMQIVSEDGMMPQMGNGPRGNSEFGDYVMTQQGFDNVLEQLMQAAGPQGPIPATEVVIEGLPRLTFTEESLAKSPYKDCPVCKDDFNVGDEVMRVPCTHVFHPDCLQPWLKVNGSCPVCRFSLVPEGGNPPSRSEPQVAPPGQGEGGSTITGMLQRLWGQSGAASTSTSNPTSPTGGIGSPTGSGTQPLPQASTSSSSQTAPTAQPPITSDQAASPSTAPASGVSDEQTSTFHTIIPDDYRERHRRREAERQNPYGDDLD